MQPVFPVIQVELEAFSVKTAWSAVIYARQRTLMRIRRMNDATGGTVGLALSPLLVHVGALRCVTVRIFGFDR